VITDEENNYLCKDLFRKPAELSRYKDGLRTGLNSREGQEIFLHIVQTGSRAVKPPIKWVLGVFSLGVMWPGSEVDHSPPSSADIKMLALYPHSLIRVPGFVQGQLCIIDSVSFRLIKILIHKFAGRRQLETLN
jgi:hypothetical protein